MEKNRHNLASLTWSSRKKKYMRYQQKTPSNSNITVMDRLGSVLFVRSSLNLKRKYGATSFHRYN